MNVRVFLFLGHGWNAVLIFSSERVIRIGVRTATNSKGKIYSTGRLRRGSNSRCCLIIIIKITMRVKLLNCAEQVQIQKYKIHAFKTLKTAGVQTIMLKHPTKQ